MNTPEPRYVALARSGELARRGREAAERLRRCDLCPRACRVDRAADETGACGVEAWALVASYGPHHGEECVLSGWAGSGTVFFGSCNLGCVFCQNWDISHKLAGEPLDGRRLGQVFLELQAMGCHNLNLVTPSHVVPQTLAALDVAASRGLRLPLVYNTSGYDSVATLRLLDGVVDVYMPDLKTLDAGFAARALTAVDYPAAATAAIAEMHRQVGDLETDAQGLATRGLLVRHLVMPGRADDSRAVFRWLRQLSADTFVNVMDQYRPSGAVPHGWTATRGADDPALERRLSRTEFDEALAAAQAAGLRRAAPASCGPLAREDGVRSRGCPLQAASSALSIKA